MQINTKAITAWIRRQAMESTPGKTDGHTRAISSMIFVKGMENYLIEINLFSEANGKREKRFCQNSPIISLNCPDCN